MTQLEFDNVFQGALTPGGPGSSGFTPGAVIIADSSGRINQDPTVFFWDATNDRLGIRTAVPDEALHIQGGHILINASGATDTAFRSKAQADGISRFLVRADGQLQWGDGTAARDVNLYRSAANILQTDDFFSIFRPNSGDAGVGVSVTADTVARAVMSTAGLEFGPGGGTARDSFLTRMAAGNLRGLATMLGVSQAAAATIAYYAFVTGDTVNRIAIAADGTMTWGSGSAAGDVVLGRSGANSLGLANGDGMVFGNKIYPGKDSAIQQTNCGLYAGSGAPNNANGADGDIYFRSDGGALTTIYQRRAGTWTGII